MTAPPSGARPQQLAVVIVTYNSGEVLDDCFVALRQAIQGAADRLTLPVDLVVVDNASRLRPEVPDTEAWRAHRLFLDENLGFSRGVNRGLDLVPAASRVLLLNPDARLESSALAALVDDMARTGAAVAGPVLIGGDGRPHGKSERPFHSLSREIVRQFAPFLGSRRPYSRAAGQTGQARCLTGACVLIDGDFLRSTDGLDTKLAMYLEDVELCQQAHEHGRGVRLVTAARCGHALGGSSGDDNFRVSTGLHLTLLAARVEFIRRHHGKTAAGLARGTIFLGACARVIAARALRRPALARKHRAALSWAVSSGQPPSWPLQSTA